MISISMNLNLLYRPFYNPFLVVILISINFNVAFSQSNCTSFNPASSWRTGIGISSTNQLVGDFDGDGKDDICSFFDGSGNYEVALSTGSSFNPASSWRTGIGISSTNQLVGDFDGDGKDDICSFFDGSGNYEVALSTGSSFNPASSWRTGIGISSSNQLSGDFNNDGNNDVCSFFNGSGNYEVALACLNVSISKLLENVGQIKVYPNPSSQNIFIDVGTSRLVIRSVIVFNHIGQEVTSVLNVAPSHQESTIEVNTQNLPEGAYFILLETNKGRFMSQLIKMN